MRRPSLIVAVALCGCFNSIPGPTGGGGAGSVDDAIEYRDDLAGHPGCTTAGLAYASASIAGYPCAAKSYGAGTGDRSIVILVHGNSDTPDEFERFDGGDPMIAETLSADGHEVIAVDLRIDQCDDPQANNDTENAARNIDHGWGVPIVERLIESVIAENPDRPIAVVGVSLGVTTNRGARDRLRLAGGT